MSNFLSHFEHCWLIVLVLTSFFSLTHCDLHNFTDWYGNTSNGILNNITNKDRLYFFEWGINLNYRSLHIRRIISDTYYKDSLVSTFNNIDSIKCRTVNIKPLDEYITYIETKYGTCQGNNCGLLAQNLMNKSTIRTLKFITNKNNVYSCGNEVIGQYKFSNITSINLTEKYRYRVYLIYSHIF